MVVCPIVLGVSINRKEIVMIVQAYLSFDGRCEEAIEFYQRTLGAEVQMLMRFKEAPEGTCPISPATDNKVMHACVRIGETNVMMSDGRCTGKANFQGFCLSISAANEAEADRLFAALADGGNVAMPLAKTFFSPRFGMVDDRFGMHWMVIVPAAEVPQRARSVERASA
jgi:PhnB protein